MPSSKLKKKDYYYLLRAINLAKNGLYTTKGNPRVGAVIVKDDKVIAEGWHRRYGDAHAEIDALSKLPVDGAKGASIYVSLEPCCYENKTPACTQALIKAGVARVICAMDDPNPKVSGQGCEALKAAGIDVDSNVMTEEAETLNPGFIKRMQQNMPFVRIKMASSLDGRTALCNGESKWITSKAARIDVQQWRARSGAIVTGVNTLIVDDPALTVRADKSWARLWPNEIKINQPLRIVVDSQLKSPLEAKFFKSNNAAIATTKQAMINNPSKVAAFQKIGVDIWPLAEKNHHVDCLALLTKLANCEINEVLIESGATLAGTFLEAGLVDEIILFQAPCLLGSEAKPLFNLAKIQTMTDKIKLQIVESRVVGTDFRHRLRIKK